ncbi:hypothetical protein [Zymomonas mobilis]|nr:hypothetical protein [Zymomonas mobilis]AVZ26932.1 hypothetical protein ZMO2_ZMOp39x029 [Zymomonas mobilis subsp. mobilis]AVZ28771.1 hypothetical protein ZMO3_ZMOp39x029 [Zymomonas mobilis subsp. mobilis]
MKTCDDNDHIIIDGHPRVSDIVRSVILAFLFQLNLRLLIFGLLVRLSILLVNLQFYNEDRKSFFVISRKIANTAIGRDAAETLSSYEILVL